MQTAEAGVLKDKLVLVTGAGGFIGSHLVERCIREGATVRAFCRYNSHGSGGWLDSSPVFQAAVSDGQAQLVLADIRDSEMVTNAMAHIDVAFHLAALIAIPYSYTAPRSYVDTNVTGTLNVLEAVRSHETPRLIQTSTSEVYGTPQSVPITEDHPLHGQSPYSATKIAADKLSEAYARSFRTPVVTLRPFNTFGPRQSSRAIIPTVLAQMLVGAPEIHLGSTSPKRDFTFVSDTCDGFVKAATTALEPGETVQLGTGTTYSVGEVIDLCKEVTGSRATVVTDEVRVRPPESEVEILLSDPSKAKDLLGWIPSVGVPEGLRVTADWLKPRADPITASRYHR